MERRAWPLAVTVFTAVWVWGLVTLPDRVPVHTDGAGHTDRWGSRWELLIGLPLIVALLGGGLVALASAVGRGKALGLVNIPHREEWLSLPDGARRLGARLDGDLRLLAALLVLPISVAFAGSIAQADAGSSDAPVWSTVAMWVTIAVIAAAVLSLATWRYRPPQR